MLKFTLITAALLTAGLATVAQANLSGGGEVASKPQRLVGPAASIETREQYYRTVAELQPVAAAATASDARPTPRIVDLPRSDGPSRAYESLPARSNTRTDLRSTQTSAERRAAPAPSTAERPADGKTTSAPPSPTAQADRTQSGKRAPGTRSARYEGGAGEVWRVGRNGHGFTGTFGGCRVTGSVGSRGYTLDRSC